MNRTKRTEAEQQALLAYLREHYEYEPKSGRLKNKLKGTIQKLDSNRTSPYYKIGVSFKGKWTKIHTHVAIWAVCKGEWPKGCIDHINNDSKDNRIENLRECSLSENVLNKVHPWKPNKDSGLPGVIRYDKGWGTKIHGKKYHFHSPYEAFFYATLCGKMYARD
jgi:hypothetical protein